VIGTAFFVMDMVPGRIVWEAHFPGLEPERARRALRRDERHHRPAPQLSIPAAIGLGDYGKAGGFVERQVARWSKQYLGDVEAGRVPTWTGWSTGSASTCPPTAATAGSSTATFAATT
jgi:aminoglycoside phosphotransferase (APT) family kinase protein